MHLWDPAPSALLHLWDPTPSALLHLWDPTPSAQMWDSIAANLGMEVWRERIPPGIELAANSTRRAALLARQGNVSWLETDGCGSCHLSSPCALHTVMHAPPDLLPAHPDACRLSRSLGGVKLQHVCAVEFVLL